MQHNIMGRNRGENIDLFTPADMMYKLPIWVDAFDAGSMLVNSSDQVSSVLNKGYAGGNFTQATDANKPLIEMGIINGRPALKGYNAATGSNLALADSVDLDYTTYSIMAVIRRHTDTGGVQQMIGGKYDTSGNQREHRLRVTSTTFTLTTDISIDGVNTSSPAATSTALTIDTNYIVEGQRGAAATASAINYALSTGLAAAVTAPFQGTSSYYLFSRNGSADPFMGYIGEYMFFNQVLSTDERKILVKYLSRKWGIQPTW